MPKDASTATTTRSRDATATKRKKKDPNAPKRPLTAYMYYAAEQREPVRKANPDVSFGQVHKLIGEKWRELSEGDKKPYEEKAAVDKKRYEDEKAKYVKTAA